MRRLHGEPGGTHARVLARGRGWSVADVVCTCRRDDRPFEEQHEQFVVAIVVAGSFEHRTTTGRALMTPGSFMLGSAGHAFECMHRYGEGDRCIAFWFAPEYVETLLSGSGGANVPMSLTAPRLAAGRQTSDLTARAVAGALSPKGAAWDELASDIAGRTWGAAAGAALTRRPAGTVEARVARSVRFIEHNPSAALTLDLLAARAGVSPFHFLRGFETVTGSTPHQYIRRTRLRRAAERLLCGQQRVIDVALDCGFNDLSHFTRSFGSEFGCSPRAFRVHRGRPHRSSRPVPV